MRECTPCLSSCRGGYYTFRGFGKKKRAMPPPNHAKCELMGEGTVLRINMQGYARYIANPSLMQCIMQWQAESR